MNKYLALVAIAARRQWADRRTIALRMVFLAVLVFVFSRLWEALKTDYHDVVNPANFVWYLLLTETVYFSRTENISKAIQDDARTGNIAYALLRPVSYYNMKLAEAMGGLLVRLPIIFVLGGAMVFAMAGGLPDTPQGLLAALVLMPFAVMLMMAAHILIGLLSFVIQDSSPLYWIYSKCDMTLGGLFFPLTIYPDWLYGIAVKTPFAWSNWGIARLAYEFSWANMAQTFGWLCFWLAAFYLVGLATFQKIATKMQVNGG